MTAQENLAFDALSDRVRRQILTVLGDEGELTVSEIAERVGSVGRTTISSHLRILRTSGVVQERREGRNRYYKVDVEGSVRDAFAYLQTILSLGLADMDTAAGASADSDPSSTRDRRAG